MKIFVDENFVCRGIINDDDFVQPTFNGKIEIDKGPFMVFDTGAADIDDAVNVYYEKILKKEIEKRRGIVKQAIERYRKLVIDTLLCDFYDYDMEKITEIDETAKNLFDCMNEIERKVK